MVNYLNKIETFSPEFEAHLRQKIQEEHFSKKSILLSPGQKCDKIWFVTSGVCAICIPDKHGGKVIVDLAMKHNIICMPEYFRKPYASRHFIEGLTEGSIQSFHYGEFTGHPGKFKEFHALKNALVKIHSMSSEEKFLMMREQSVEERIKKCLELYPGIQDAIAGYNIAHFLNISPETLSRQKKK